MSRAEKPDPASYEWGRTESWRLVQERIHALHVRRESVMRVVYDLREQTEKLRKQNKALWASAEALVAAELPHASTVDQAKLKQSEFSDSMTLLNHHEIEWNLINRCMEHLGRIHDDFFCLVAEEERLQRFDREREASAAKES